MLQCQYSNSELIQNTHKRIQPNINWCFVWWRLFYKYGFCLLLWRPHILIIAFQNAISTSYDGIDMQICCYWTLSIELASKCVTVNLNKCRKKKEAIAIGSGAGNDDELNWNYSWINKPKSGGKSTEFGAGDFISAAIGPRRAVGVHGCCLTPIL